MSNGVINKVVELWHENVRIGDIRTQFCVTCRFVVRHIFHKIPYHTDDKYMHVVQEGGWLHDDTNHKEGKNMHDIPYTEAHFKERPVEHVRALFGFF